MSVTFKRIVFERSVQAHGMIDVRHSLWERDVMPISGPMAIDHGALFQDNRDFDLTVEEGKIHYHRHAQSKAAHIRITVTLG